MKTTSPRRLDIRWLMLAVPALIVTVASLWTLVSVTLEAAAGSQPGDLLFPVREQALELQLSLASDPQERAEIEIRLSATPIPLATTGVGAEPNAIGAPAGGAGSTDAPYVGDDDSTPTTGSTEVEATEAPKSTDSVEASKTPSGNSGPGGGPSATHTPEPTRTDRPTQVVEPTRTQEPTRTVEPTRTQEPTRTTEPTRTAEPTRTVEPTRTPEPTQTPSSGSGSGSGGGNPAGPTETPQPADVTFQGTLEATGGTWVVGGQSFQVNGGTDIRGNPQIGNTVEVRALRYWDGSVVAYRVEVK